MYEIELKFIYTNMISKFILIFENALYFTFVRKKFFTQIYQKFNSFQFTEFCGFKDIKFFVRTDVYSLKERYEKLTNWS